MNKDTIRESVWDDLDESGEARFPYPPHGRIPNFAGAEDAANRMAQEEWWQEATAIKANPDAPQLSVRRRALRAGKIVYMAVPRLRSRKPFLALDPNAIDDIDEASTISGASTYGQPVAVDEVPQIDVIVSGSVAVDKFGVRVGKGEGYSDLEFAILTEAGRVNARTVVATTVHERQVWPEPIEPAAHDVPIDFVATPEREFVTEIRTDRPDGLDWSRIGPEMIEEIPVLHELQR